MVWSGEGSSSTKETGKDWRTAIWRSGKSGSGSGRTKKEEREESVLSKSVLVLSRHIIADIFHCLKNIKKPWFYTSRRLVIRKTVFHVPDLTFLLNVPKRVTTKHKNVYFRVKKLFELEPQETLGFTY